MPGLGHHWYRSPGIAHVVKGLVFPESGNVCFNVKLFDRAWGGMFGGTPPNMSLSFLDEQHVEVVTGINLPMLIKLATLSEEKPLEELATFIKEYGQRNISVASELLPGARD